LEHVYSEDLDPTSPAFAGERAQAPGSAGGGKAGGEKGSDPRTMADLINACLHDEMRRDPRIVVYGEDVADASRADAWPR
jgi:2-oxoisovalerate dehydrogenase E1 component